jgi:Gpi18-like mannosyltransferase
MVWCPFSLFCTVAYTEGVFLLVSTASLRAYEQHQYAWASLWGALATATRANGLALIPTFLIVAWREKRLAIAYISAGAIAIGFLLFSLYCAVRFGDPLAFVQAQKGWQDPGFQLSDWWDLLTKDLLWRRGRDRAIEAVTKIIMLFGGGYLIWRFRNKLNFILVVYAFCSIALIINSGAIRSIERFTYAIVSMSVVLGLLLARHQRLGYVTLSLFALWLAYFSLRFTLRLWVS